MGSHLAGFSWTPDRVSELQSLWQAGNSASQISLLLKPSLGEPGPTRAAVLGKLHRMELAMSPTSAKLIRLKIPRPGVAAKPDAKPRKKPAPKPPELSPTEAIALAPELPPVPVSIWKLEPNHCRWPCDGDGLKTLFCGADKGEAVAYCEHHAAIAYKR